MRFVCRLRAIPLDTLTHNVTDSDFCRTGWFGGDDLSDYAQCVYSPNGLGGWTKLRDPTTHARSQWRGLATRVYASDPLPSLDASPARAPLAGGSSEAVGR